MQNEPLQISQRGIDMPASPIRKLAPLAYAAEDKGGKIYRLIGQPGLPTSQRALDVLKMVDRRRWNIDGKVAGMYAGVLNHRKDCILVPRLAINMDYKFYSPGYVMLCESFKYILSNSTVRNIDLSVGAEQYKLDLGGIKYSTAVIECYAGTSARITR